MIKCFECQVYGVLNNKKKEGWISNSSSQILVILMKEVNSASELIKKEIQHCKKFYRDKNISEIKHLDNVHIRHWTWGVFY